MTALNLKAYAEEALDRAFHIFPLKSQSKLPATEHGFKDASFHPAEIDAWWDANPQFNIGIACGESNLCVLDFDNGEDLPDWLKTTKTLKVKTSRGIHVYFYGARESAKLFIDGKHVGEIKSRGGYVLAAGSVHPAGPIYTVVDDSPIATAPDKISELLNRAGHEGKSDSWMAESIPDGQRNNTLHAISGALREFGLPVHAIHAAVSEINNQQCEPPIGPHELKTLVESAGKYPVGETTVTMNGVPLDGPDGIRARLENRATSPQKVPAQNIDQQTIDVNFPAYDGKPPKQPEMLIDGFLMRGVNFFGSLSGIGKSWAALAVAKCLTTGEPLFGVFPVKQVVPVLYLIPESDEAGFKYRLGVIGMPRNAELFRYRTISQGKTLSLVDDLTLAAIRYLHHDGKYPHVLVIVDTAVRFMVSGSDMKSATNNTLSNDAETLRSPEVGADILFLHHSPKAASKQDMTLENVLRDTGDFGAMSDAVYGLRRDDKLFDYGDGPEEIEVINVKMRAPERPKPFRVRLKRKPEQGEGDRPVSVVGCIGGLPCVGEQEASDNLADRVGGIIANNPDVSYRAIKNELHIHHDKIRQLAESRGWRQQARNVLDRTTGRTGRQFYWTQVVSSANSVNLNESGKAA